MADKPIREQSALELLETHAKALEAENERLRAALDSAATLLEKAYTRSGIPIFSDEVAKIREATRGAVETPAAPPGVMDVLKLQAQTDAAVAGLNPLMRGKCPTCGMSYFKYPMQD